MKRNRLVSCLCAAMLGFLLSLGGTWCMTTGLQLPVDVGLLAAGCAFGAIIPAICLYFRKGELFLSGIVLAFSAFMAFSSQFRQQLLAMCFSILDYYNKGYGIPIPDQIAGCTADSQLLPMLFIAGIVAVSTVFTVMRKMPSILAVTMAVLPLASCLVVTDTVPDAMPIFLLLLGLVLLLATQGVRRQSSAQGNKLTAMLLMPVAIGIAALFLMIPQSSYSPPPQLASAEDLLQWFSNRLPFLDYTHTGQPIISYGDHVSGEVNLSELGDRVEYNTPVMEVVTDYRGKLYLRARDYDIYTGSEWLPDFGNTEYHFGLISPVWRSPSQHLSIRVLGRHGQYYLPYYPTEEQTLIDGIVPNPERESEYAYAFSPLRSDWKVLWNQMQRDITFPLDAEPADERYLYLPSSTHQQASRILQEIDFSYARNPHERADAIGKYVEQSAAYDLKPGQMPSSENDFALWFLKNSDKGYCVHFATAATVLLRSAGIPARYVEGYTLETEPGQTVTVRQKNAHAWVEYYVDHLGWVVLDPTPSINSTPENTTAPSTKPSQTEPPETTQPSAPSEATKPGVPSEPEASASHSGGQADDQLPQWFVAVLTTVLILSATIFLIALQWCLRRWLILKKLHRGNINAQAVARYREAVRLGKVSHTPIPRELTALAQKARFSQHKLTDEELKQFDRFIQSCTLALQKQPWYRRLIYRFIFAAY